MLVMLVVHYHLLKLVSLYLLEIFCFHLQRILNPIMANDFIFRMTSQYNMWKEALEVVNSLSEKLIRERKRMHEETSHEVTAIDIN